MSIQINVLQIQYSLNSLRAYSLVVHSSLDVLKIIFMVDACTTHYLSTMCNLCPKFGSSAGNKRGATNVGGGKTVYMCYQYKFKIHRGKDFHPLFGALKELRALV